LEKANADATERGNKDAQLYVGMTMERVGLPWPLSGVGAGAGALTLGAASSVFVTATTTEAS
jgi:hypothetical protein